MPKNQTSIGQTVQHNRERYFAELNYGHGWDAVVLTAGTQAQADCYRHQIDQRRKRGQLPPSTEFLVVPDPAGVRVGSGGSTLLALAHLHRHFEQPAGKSAGDFFRRHKFLILHSGGESRRLPIYSGIGKLFARVPLAAGNGVSSLFDEFLISLSGAPRQFREGVTVASGDVLLLFDNMQLQFHPQGVVGVSMPAPPATACRHGVYLADRAGRVRRFLHKMDPESLARSGALENGTAQIDTGIVWFDAATLDILMDIAGLLPSGGFGGPNLDLANRPLALSLYADMLSIMATETRRADYLEGPGDNGKPPAQTLRAARRILWDSLRGVPFHVSRLSEARFIHFGTSAEYRRAMLEGALPRSGLNWQRRVAAVGGQPSNSTGPDDNVWLNSFCRGPTDVQTSLIEDACLGAGATVRAGLISRVQTLTIPVELPPGCVLFQTPVRRRGLTMTATFVLGLDDNPKIPAAQGGTFCNRSWRPSESPWPEGWPPEWRNLWYAALFPVDADRDTSLRQALALAARMNAPGNGTPWPANENSDVDKISLNDALEAFDPRQAADEELALEDRIAAEDFKQAVLQGVPASDRATMPGAQIRDFRRRLDLAVADAETLNRPLETLRILYCAGEALTLQGNFAKNTEAAVQGNRYRDRAFEYLAELIRGKRTRCIPARPKATLRTAVTVEAAARLDFGGGWSDTPPFSLYSEGTVLNAAVTINGALPIKVYIEQLPQARIELRSLDLDVAVATDRTEPILDYRDPADPFALHKAALVLCGAVPEKAQPVAGLFTDGPGLRVTSDIAVPKGSGLGTSSILAGALLTGLYRYHGRRRSERKLFEDIFDLEQMLTTGGGWQDQVGGLTAGLKLTSSSPGVPPPLSIALLRPSAAVSAALDRRLALIYTGRRRLAKGILRAIMGRYLANDGVVLRTLHEIQDIAREMKAALMAGDLDSLGRLMTRHWELNKSMDPGSTTPAIDALFAALKPYVAGAKLAGAGGGGFIEAVIGNPDGDTAAIRGILRRDFPAAALWPCRITMQPVKIVESMPEAGAQTVF